MRTRLESYATSTSRHDLIRVRGVTQSVTRSGPGESAVGEMLTYYDDATGERTGLTPEELGEWAAGTAAMLTEGCRLRPGDRAGILLPPHWQTAAILLGAWAAGLAVSFRGWSTAGLAPAGEPLDVTFVERRRIGSWLDDVPAGGHQFSLLGGPPPMGYDDFVGAVRPWLGSAPPVSLARAHDAAMVSGETFGEYRRLADTIAHQQGIGPGDRVLIDAAGTEQPLMWLLAPLAAGASVVLCANLDRALLDDRIHRERVTRVVFA